MRIAVLLSGEYRKFDVCRDTMSFLLDDPVVDVYVSTWDKTRYLQNLINVSQTEFVNVEQIEQILNRPAVIEIESIDDYLNQRAVKYNNFMIHRWKQGINLIKNSNIKYDYIVISRFDLFFNPRGRNATLQEVINLNPASNVLMATWSNAESLSNGILNDVFLLAPYDTMINLMDNLSIEERFTKISEMMPIESPIKAEMPTAQQAPSNENYKFWKLKIQIYAFKSHLLKHLLIIFIFMILNLKVS